MSWDSFDRRYTTSIFRDVARVESVGEKRRGVHHDIPV